MRADGIGEPELVLATDAQIDQGLWSPDGEWLIYRVGATAGVRDIFARRLSGDSATIAVSAHPEADEDSPAISPDGRWIAYVSDESGEAEIYVRPFPNTQDRRVQVSSGGASAPVWSPDGDQLYYISAANGGTLNSAFVETGSSLSVDSTVALFPRGNFILNNRHARYVVTPDGEQFLIVRLEEAADSRRDLIRVEGLLGELKERLRD
jgi:WD40 repeat protein